MKKIYIIIFFILCVFLTGCDKSSEFYNEKEILEYVYNGFLDTKRIEYDDKYNGVDFISIKEDIEKDLDIFKLNFESSGSLSEALIYKKRYVAGYINNKTVNKITKDLSYEYELDIEKGYSNLYSLYANAYQDGLIYLESDKTYLYSFKDGIPLEYDNKKLVFVILYYEVEVNDRVITPIIYTRGRLIDDFYYCDEPIFYMDYGRCLYLDQVSKNVMSLQEFYSCSKADEIRSFYLSDEIIRCKTISEDEFNKLSSEEQELYIECFNLIQKNYDNIEFEFDTLYVFEYDVIKEIFIK